ncbi:MAG TPA: endonuclease III [Planctomycetota bacterium]|nr:endonuclease III [Planctomycetota bacterium]
MKPKLRALSPQLVARAKKIDIALRVAFSDAKCSLNYANPLQLLIATILSAQCTDARVNMVTPALFARYKTAADFANSDPAELEKLIQSTGFFRSKAKSIREACKDIVALHAGKVPDDLEALHALHGVGRKTANVVLGNAFNVPGMVVDTHVGRISRRLGLTKNTDPVKVEQDLMRIFPKERWTSLGHEMILLGRKFCKAPTPRCGGCPIVELCPYKGKVFE